MPRNIQQAWSAPTVIDIDPATLVIVDGVLAAQAQTGNWSAAAVSAIGTGLVNTSGTLNTAPPAVTFNAQVGTSYALQSSDRGKLVTFTNAAPIAVSLAQAGSAGFGSGWFCDVMTTGAGTVTVTPTTSTINGLATLVRTTIQGARIISNGTNYIAQLNG